MGSENRQRPKKVSFRVTGEEKAWIKAQADLCDMSLAAYSRSLVLGHTPKSNVDQQQFAELAGLHADLGRMGGLLKLWLSDHQIKVQGKALNIDELINDIRITQIALKQKARELSIAS